ncbi:hypothetical protein BB560_003829 [Smittium megazygosporum]|uniref:Uncharacterized protein n=1 Tax=Smittium megazygosporum TaxID=133381 RepID=A0A2T9ZAV2_9FUNG|nr:hypothetical protein BB560_003829 [Smittium megazygosporum]
MKVEKVSLLEGLDKVIGIILPILLGSDEKSQDSSRWKANLVSRGMEQDSNPDIQNPILLASFNQGQTKVENPTLKLEQRKCDRNRNFKPPHKESYRGGIRREFKVLFQSAFSDKENSGLTANPESLPTQPICDKEIVQDGIFKLSLQDNQKSKEVLPEIPQVQFEGRKTSNIEAKGIRIGAYLDDLIILENSAQECNNNTQIVTNYGTFGHQNKHQKNDLTNSKGKAEESQEGDELKNNAIKSLKSWEKTIEIDFPAMENLVWWRDNLLQWNPFGSSGRPGSDASGSRLKIVTGNTTFYGKWKSIKKSLQINAKELLAILKAMKLQMAFGKAVKIYSDNNTTISYVKKFGETTSSALLIIFEETLDSDGVVNIQQHVPQNKLKIRPTGDRHCFRNHAISQERQVSIRKDKGMVSHSIAVKRVKYEEEGITEDTIDIILNSEQTRKRYKKYDAIQTRYFSGVTKTMLTIKSFQHPTSSVF